MPPISPSRRHWPFDQARLKQSQLALLIWTLLSLGSLISCASPTPKPPLNQNIPPLAPGAMPSEDATPTQPASPTLNPPQAPPLKPSWAPSESPDASPNAIPSPSPSVNP